MPTTRTRPRGRVQSSRSSRVAAALRTVPKTAWVCALIAVLNAACWSILIPPLQGPDEQAHFAYTQLLAETGRLPTSAEENFSSEELAAMNDLGFGETILDPGTDPVPTLAAHLKLQHDLAAPLSRKGSDGSAGVASSEPPLYYGLQVIPYALGAGSSVLDRMELMRLFSALLTGLTVLFVFLFLREALPGAPWAWTVGALCASLSPLLAFVGGSIDPDALLFVVCAAMFFCLARAFRRGFTRGMAIAIGSVIATGLLTKVNFVGLVPGVFLGLLLLTLREARSSGRAAYRSLGVACAIVGIPAVLYIGRNLLNHQAALGIISGSIATVNQHPLWHDISYMWQFYLPRLPGMVNDFPGITPLWDIWFKGIVARYNWLETVFPEWVYEVALIPAAAVAGLCLRELYAMRSALRSRIPEFVTYLVIGIGLMAMLAAASIGSFPTLAAGDSEPRYFLPLLALGCALLALAARGAGRRWGPVAGVAIVVLFFTHDVLSQLLEISRYYHPLHY
jgi:4-amino-4-deoxy-L-arabinose transferase-like glycosyltransferase